MMVRCLALGLFLAVASESTASADFSGPLSSGSFETTMNMGPIAQSLNQQVVGRNQTSQPLESVRLITTKYRAESFRTRKNLANFVAKTRITDSAQADKMEQLFASGDIIDQIDGMMQAKGLSISNTADAYAVWWVNAWEAANNVNSGESSSRQLQAVSAQAARAFSASSQFASASDAQKQEMAEAMLIQAALIDASKEDYAGDANLMQKLADAVKQGAKRSGLDLDAMTLTEDGFVAVKGRKTGAADSTDNATNPATEPTGVAANDADNSDTGNWALIAAAGGAGLAGVFLFGKAMGKKG